MDSFTLVSWNVLADVHITDAWYPHVAPEDLRGPVRRRRVVDHLLRLNADVMVLQEVDAELLVHLRDAFPDHGMAHIARAGEGLATFVRGARPWSRVLPIPGRTPRALWVHLPGGLRLVNVHLKWTGDPRPGVERAGLRQLDAVLDYGPDLVAGDFNAFPAWPERQRARDRGYTDVGPRGPTCNVHQRLQPLDAVMLRGPWRARPSALPTIHASTPMPSATFPSDHLPVFVEISRHSA